MNENIDSIKPWKKLVSCGMQISCQARLIRWYKYVYQASSNKYQLSTGNKLTPLRNQNQECYDWMWKFSEKSDELGKRIDTASNQVTTSAITIQAATAPTRPDSLSLNSCNLFSLFSISLCLCRFVDYMADRWRIITMQQLRNTARFL